MSKNKRNTSKRDNSINFKDAVKSKVRETTLVPKSLNQEKYIRNLQDSSQHIVIAHGPAGTGKTYIAMQAAIKAFRSGDCERIVLTRPAVGVEGEEHGFLPGSLEEKMAPWTRPLIDVLREYYTPQEISAMLEDQTVEISPLAFMRGRTFKSCFIVADEMQNATPKQLKMLMTRIGKGSKIVITGDVEQADKRQSDNGLSDLCDRLNYEISGITICELTKKDCQRHHIISEVLNLYKDL